MFLLGIVSKRFLGSVLLVEHLSLEFEFIQNSNVALKAI